VKIASPSKVFLSSAGVEKRNGGGTEGAPTIRCFVGLELEPEERSGIERRLDGVTQHRYVPGF
jgi:hypothetical protein